LKNYVLVRKLIKVY